MKPKLISMSGAALLILLAVIVVAFAVTLTSAISINGIRNTATKKSINAMQTAKQALEGFALRQEPIGALPCPDTNQDGFANTSGGDCVSLLGLLPYKTLDLPRLRDGYGNALWYAVEQNLSLNNASLKNPSISTTLHLGGRFMAALIISPNRELGNQVRSTPYNADDFLEGVNADADLSRYARVIDDQHNDQILELDLSSYWTLIQPALLSQMSERLVQYRNACGEFPWAADFGSAPYNAVVNQRSGTLPYHTALPTDWNTGCANGIVLSSGWLTHWGEHIYYSMCTMADVECIELNGDQTTSVDAVLISPGVPLAGQVRASSDLDDYFEEGNSSSASPFQFRFKRNFDAGFNDVLIPLSP